MFLTTTRVVVLTIATLSLGAGRLLAHHSFAAEFDATNPIRLKGSITKWERINPHGWIYIDVKQADGTVKNWAVETGAPTALARAGIKKESLPIGIEVVVKGYRAKDGSNTATGNIITLPDGKDLSLAPSIGAPSKTSDGGGYK